MSALLNAQLSSGLTFPVQWEAMQDVSSQWMCQLALGHLTLSLAASTPAFTSHSRNWIHRARDGMQSDQLPLGIIALQNAQE